MNSTNT